MLSRVWDEPHGCSPGAPRQALLRGTGALSASLRTHSSLGTSPLGRRPLVEASKSSPFWVMRNSSETASPKEGGTKSCLFLPLGV